MQDWVTDNVDGCVDYVDDDDNDNDDGDDELGDYMDIKTGYRMQSQMMMIMVLIMIKLMMVLWQC